MSERYENPSAIALRERAEASLVGRLAFYLNPFDGRYEDLGRNGNFWLNVFRDFTAGLIVAMIAIPLAMGFAMASGLRPEQGIVGGAIAGAVGALFGGSKYQVYGPTAAFIPVIAAIMAKHGYGFLVLASILAGIVLILMGLIKSGRYVSKVPHSIVVGFTIGIAIVIATSQLGEVLGIKAKLGYEMTEKLHGLMVHANEISIYAIIIALITFAVSKICLKISPFIPGPLIGVGIGTLLASTVWADRHLITIKDKFGSIPANSLIPQMPQMIPLTPSILMDLAFFVTAIVFVSAVESLLCSRMADRLANNTGTPFHADKELWGQGWVQIIVPMLNGFPHTGALARTAANIKLGAISPLAGIFKCILKLLLAAFLASWLELVPMACIGGILLYVATNMVKKEEITEVWAMDNFQRFLMIYTAIMVPATDFLKGVLSAVVIWLIASRFIKSEPHAADVH